MRTDLFDYDLPRHLIATDPPAERGGSRLMVIDRARPGRFDQTCFDGLDGYLHPGDLLVVNDTRVMNARLSGVRMATGAEVEVLLLERADGVTGTATGAGDAWTVLARPAKKFRTGERFRFGTVPETVEATVTGEGPDGERTLVFATDDLTTLLAGIGSVPLPPYIVQRRRELERPATIDADTVRYQTVYAREPGSVAAPTAGLHFTQAHLDRLKAAGVATAPVTLHVGAGTFRTVEADDLDDHPMHRERYDIPAATADLIDRTRAAGGRVVAVGTTVCRTLEAAARAVGGATRGDGPGLVKAGPGSTDILIAPGHRFAVVDALITNFHLPRSTLMALVSALAGLDDIMAAYAAAIAGEFRFFSYGDAMLIV